MPRFVTLSWSAQPDAPGGRRARAAFRYEAFVPDLIASLDPILRSDEAESLSRAERAVLALNENPPSLASLEVLARRLLRAESVASSRIEGLVLSHRRLAKAEIGGDDSRDETAQSVLANIAAMEKAVSLAASPRPVKASDIARIHSILMQGPGGDAGVCRTEQNWIGGNAFNPHGAAFVPPPPKEVPGLMKDLCKFLEREDLPAIAQAAIAHAQFETIHPFGDGNGRVGRALIHVVLRRRGLAPRYVPPVSLVLAGNSGEYIHGLESFREGKAGSWCAMFAHATETAARKSIELASRFSKLQEVWLEKAGHPRSDSSAAALIARLSAYPILSVATAEQLLGRSRQAANEAMSQLEKAGVLKRVNIGKRNRAWEAPGVFDLLNDFERELSLPQKTTKQGRAAPFSGRGSSRRPSSPGQTKRSH